jgi:hypothetical protein
MTKLYLPWAYQFGVLLIVIAMMMAIVVFALPIFEERRASAFWTVILPLAASGGCMIAYQHYRARGGLIRSIRWPGNSKGV